MKPVPRICRRGVAHMSVDPLALAWTRGPRYRTAMAERADVVLLGGTGYTGQLVLRYLATLPPAERGQFAVAGRDLQRLKQVLATAAPELQPTIIAVDAEDPAAVDAMAAQARVVMHLAGPYTTRGPAVVAACVRHGSHYVDLTGEALFARDMIEEHHHAAGARGVRIVHCCGFECLPFDLATLYAASTLQTRYGIACAEVQLALEMRIHDSAVLRDAALSGGTTATILLLLQDPRGEEMLDPALLLPPETDPAPTRARHPLPTGARWDPLTDSWATPVYPVPTINPQVIARSVALCVGPQSPFSDEFRYRECASLRGMVPAAAQGPAASAISALIDGGLRVVAKGRPWTRALLARAVRAVGAPSGKGPRPELLDRFDYGILARAIGPSGEEVTATLTGLGNPGYLSTAKMVTQAALALAHDGERLPRHHGVLTPATALGLPFVERLARAGVTISG